MSTLIMEKKKYACVRSRIVELQAGMARDLDPSRKFDAELLKRAAELNEMVDDMVCLLEDEIADKR